MSRNWRKIILLAAGLALAALLVTGCGSREDEVLVKVDGEDITRSQLDDVLKMVRLVTPDVDAMLEDEDFTEYFEDTFLRMLVDNALIANEMERLELEVDPAEMEEVYETFRSQLVAELYQGEEMLDQRLQDLNLEAEVIKGLLYGEVAANILFDNLLENLTDEDVREYADEYDLLLVSGSLVAHHILLETEEEGLEALERLNRGEEFGLLAEELSTCPSGTNSQGELGRIHEDDPGWDADFREAAFALQEGEISQLVESQFGWHIIMVEDRIDSYYKDFEEEKESLRLDKEQMLINDYFNELWEKAEIEFLISAG